MIKAFAAGGDFHSRTAMGMYSHVADAVNKGEVLLEVEDADAAGPPKPLLKNVFASERKKAKVSGVCVRGSFCAAVVQAPRQRSQDGSLLVWLSPGSVTLGTSASLQPPVLLPPPPPPPPRGTRF
jgi:hypothetical protein